MRIAILYDGSSLARWQHEAISRLGANHEIVYLVNTSDGPSQKRQLRHALYYLLNLFTIRNPASRKIAHPVPDGAKVKTFEPIQDGAWSALPPDAIAWLEDMRIDAVLKFSLNLLRIPNAAPPILSFHHGDPRSYRGRPAGFYELLAGESFIGQIVQVLSNRLDAGTVLAFTQTRAYPHSYRKSLIEAYSASPLLLGEALDALEQGRTVPFSPDGRNYRLPGNGTVARFVVGLWAATARRLAYGLFMEKRWAVSMAAGETLALPDWGDLSDAEPSRWTTPKVGHGYSFYADPFFVSGPDDIMVEALDKRTGKGRLVRIRGETHEPLNLSPQGHVSYPQCLEVDGRSLVFPEIAAWSGPALYELTDERLKLVQHLDVDAKAILDPTLFRWNDRCYLFGNEVDDGSNTLSLWVAGNVFGRFERHPSSPVRIGSRGSRMAGCIEVDGGRLFRFGQDCRKGYGDGILCFEIQHIDDSSYEEELVSELAFRHVKGPHTFNRLGNTILFDWYVEKFSLLAGVRRIMNRF